MSSIYVHVLKAAPHSLPSVKLRDNAHVSKDEWDWLKGLARDAQTPNVSGQDLQELIALALRKQYVPLIVDSELTQSAELFSMMGVADESQWRLYPKEVVEISKDISYILLAPPSDQYLAHVDGSLDAYMRHDTCVPISKKYGRFLITVSLIIDIVPMNGRRGLPISRNCTRSRLPLHPQSTQRASDWLTVSGLPSQTPRQSQPKRPLHESHHYKIGPPHSDRKSIFTWSFAD